MRTGVPGAQHTARAQASLPQVRVHPLLKLGVVDAVCGAILLVTVAIVAVSLQLLLGQHLTYSSTRNVGYHATPPHHDPRPPPLVVSG